MTYAFPKTLAPLREFLAGQGADVKSFVSARQAAFMAQQIIGSRVKFPPQGQDMTSTLLSIQNALSLPGRSLPTKSTKVSVKQRKNAGRSDAHHKAFTADMFIDGVHIFCDGAAVPNPGLGGWGVAVFKDGVEIDEAYGGEADATNNQMELTAVLNAIEKAAHLIEENPDAPVTIWCDSQYCVNGVNDWRHSWKAKGWQRGGPNAQPENRVLMNAELWKAIDVALSEFSTGTLNIKWVKGHVGIAGNERADELAEIGRQEAESSASESVPPSDDLDERYRQIMGAM